MCIHDRARRTHSQVAVKRLKTDREGADKESLERELRHETRLLAALSHPWVPTRLSNVQPPTHLMHARTPPCASSHVDGTWMARGWHVDGTWMACACRSILTLIGYTAAPPQIVLEVLDGTA